MPLYVGTSGWDYAHWNKVFYPRGSEDRLAYYASRFPTVELNGTFYRLPERATFSSWRRRTPAEFIFATKASRFLTHLRRLRDPEEPAQRFLARARSLGAKLGPVLIQLRPGFAPEPQRLDETLAAFAGVRVAVEFRDPRWFTPRVRSTLERHGAALCIADRASKLVTPAWRTADWGYMRFHSGRTTTGCYGRHSLRARAALLAGLFPARADVFVYFNNDGHGCALRDAATFTNEARRAGLDPVSSRLTARRSA